MVVVMFHNQDAVVREKGWELGQDLCIDRAVIGGIAVNHIKLAALPRQFAHNLHRITANHLDGLMGLPDLLPVLLDHLGSFGG
jgi:hypothetical protein